MISGKWDIITNMYPIRNFPKNRVHLELKVTKDSKMSN